MSSLIPFNRRNNELQTGLGGVFSLFDIGRAFENFFNDSFFPAHFMNSAQMKVDIKENDKEYVLEAELPGIDKEDISLEVRNNMLTISVNRDEKIEEKRDNYIRRERRACSMARSFSLENVNADKITAKHENGILTVVLPKKNDVKTNSRRIDIS